VIGHRGASGYRPEHSRAAYELAFELGADAVEPDIVASSDGVLVLRHENEISGTTDVAAHAEFASRKTTKTIDGERLTGWFTEDFTWAELSTLRAVERLPLDRPASAAFDGQQPILRLADLLAIIDEASAAQGRPLVLVAEIKHATYFASIGLPLDELFAAEIAHWATPHNLVVESFEQSVLMQIRRRGIPGRLVFLAEATGAPADLVAAHGTASRTYAQLLGEGDDGLAALAGQVDGVSVSKKQILGRHGVTDLVRRAHAVGLTVFCWTLRSEERFVAKHLHGDWRREFALILSSGLDGVFADQPDLALDAVNTAAATAAPAADTGPATGPATGHVGGNA
jgi:glycerophosphoryl diester phosphodiesterase